MTIRASPRLRCSVYTFTIQDRCREASSGPVPAVGKGGSEEIPVGFNGSGARAGFEAHLMPLVED